MHALGRGYSAAGHEVLLIVPGPAHAEEKLPEGRRITVRSPVVPFTGGYRVILRRGRVRRLLRDFGPDVVEVSDRTTLRGVGRWARRRRIPSVFFAHERADGVLLANSPRWLVPRKFARFLADAHNRGTSRRFTTIVCTTAYAAEEFERVGIPTATISLGVDLDLFRPSNYSQELRDSFARPEETLLVMGSRLSKEKHPELAIGAVSELGSRGHQVRLVCAGSGNLDERMREDAAGLPVTFLGFVGERQRFADLLATADVVLAPGPIETFGLAALEALASGTPVVVNASSALPEVVGPAGVGSANNPESFADGVESLLHVDSVERRMRARERAEQFPWSKTCAQMLALHGENLAHYSQERQEHRNGGDS